MTAAAILDELRGLGTEKTAATYRRHGVEGEVLGVAYADLNRLRKRIKRDHTLARDLWRSGIHEARVLATMVADPDRAEPELLEEWAADLRYHVLADAFADYVAQTQHALDVADRWCGSADTWRARAGWHIVTKMAPTHRSFDHTDMEDFLLRIEAGIRDAPNRVKEEMNRALIAIGSRDEMTRDRAIDVARRIGQVEVDHGDTACETPLAEPYIQKVWARKRS